jgi:2-iminobutanoate/2-iminopropanoate deaminase
MNIKVSLSAFLLSIIMNSTTIHTQVPMNQTVKTINSSHAPQPIGPYSQAILTSNNMLFISGQIPFDMEKKELVSDIAQATKLVMSYLQAILQQAGMDFSNVVKASIFLTSMNDFPLVNEIYSTYFTNVEQLPARETIAVAALPKGACIEISMIAS